MTVRVHTAGPVCKGCQDKLEGADPIIAEWFNKIIKPEFPDCHVAWAFRGEVDQNSCFNANLSGVRWPNSKHNKMDAAGKPKAEALDLFRQTDKGADWSKTYYAKIADHSSKSGFSGKIKWGTRNGTDLDHFEMIKPKGA